MEPGQAALSSLFISITDSMPVCDQTQLYRLGVNLSKTSKGIYTNSRLIKGKLLFMLSAVSPWISLPLDIPHSKSLPDLVTTGYVHR